MVRKALANTGLTHTSPNVMLYPFNAKAPQPFLPLHGWSNPKDISIREWRNPRHLAGCGATRP
jgi:hypothetical protein